MGDLQVSYHSVEDILLLPEVDFAPVIVAEVVEMCIVTTVAPSTMTTWRNQELSFATWNTMTLSDHILRWTLQTAGYDVLVLTETHGVPPSFQLLQREFPNRIFCSVPGDKSDSAAGIVIVLSKQAANLVIANGTEDSRMAWIRLKGIYNITVVGCYIPHAHKWRAPFQAEYLQDLENNCQNLQETYSRDCFILMGDMNVKLARNTKGLTGKFSMHAENSEGGERFMELMRNTHLVHSSSHFVPSSTAPLGAATFYRKATEKRQRCLSQIDHICVSERYSSSVQNSKVSWYPSIRRHTERYDHGLLSIEFKFRIAARPKQSLISLDYSQLRCEKVRAKLDELIGQKLHEARYQKNEESPKNLTPWPNSCLKRHPQGETTVEISENTKTEDPSRSQLSATANPFARRTLNAEYSELTSVVQEAQKEILPKKPKRKYLTRPVSAEANDLIEERARQCQAAKSGKGKRAVKETFRRRLAAQLKYDWEAHVQAQVEEVKRHAETGNSKDLWRAIHSISGRSRSYSNQQPSADSASALRAIWFAAMSKSVSATGLESNRCAKADIGPASNRKDEPLPTDDELEICLRALRGSKAAGPDDVPIEIWRASGHAKAALFDIIRRVVREEVLPDDMPLGELCMIFKNKGSCDDTKNFRHICLLNHAYKILSTWLLYRLQKETSETKYIPENQAAFQAGRSCRDHITLLRILIDRILEIGETAVITFVDLTNAFGSVSQKFLDEALGDAGVSNKSRAIFRAIYDKARARVRVKGDAGERTATESFPIDRGILQGDMFSPLCFLIALAYAFKKADPGGGSDKLGWLIQTLTYADDAALIDNDAETATARITALAVGLRELADMEISCKKTECIFIQEQVSVETTHLFEDSNAEAKEKILMHSCQACGRGFSSYQGLKTHEAKWCGWADKLDREKDWEVDEVLDARGCPTYRFYLVRWKGYGEEDNSWIPKLWAEGCEEKVNDFWQKRGLCADTAAIPENPWKPPRGKVKNARCMWCCKFYAREQDLKTHLTIGCKCKPGSRTGSATERAMVKEKKRSMQRQAGEVYCEDYLLENVFNFTYLGSDFQADGAHRNAAIVRMGLAKTVFGKMMNIWKSDLALPVKLNLFGAAVVTVMSHGFESWCLDNALLSTLRGWNARCLAHITGNSISEEARHPTYDLISTLKLRRLKWARQELTTHVQEGRRPTARGLIFVAEKMLAAGGYDKGFVLEDAPAHDSIEELLELSWEDWDENIRKLDTRKPKTKSKSKSKNQDTARCNKTGEEYIQKMKKNMVFTG